LSVCHFFSSIYDFYLPLYYHKNFAFFAFSNYQNVSCQHSNAELTMPNDLILEACVMLDLSNIIVILGYVEVQYSVMSKYITWICRSTIIGYVEVQSLAMSKFNARLCWNTIFGYVEVQYSAKLKDNPRLYRSTIIGNVKVQLSAMSKYNTWLYRYPFQQKMFHCIFTWSSIRSFTAFFTWNISQKNAILFL
jgi:hypothetical protein